MSRTRFDELASDGLLDLSAPGAGHVKFPAVKNPSADPHTCDDYDENDVVVTLDPLTSGSITLDPAFDTLSYTKHGRKVTYTGTLVVSAVAAPVGHLRIAGLAHTSGNHAKFAAAAAVYAEGLAAGATTAIQGLISNNSSVILLTKFAAGAAAALAGNVQAGTTLYISLTFFTGD